MARRCFSDGRLVTVCGADLEGDSTCKRQCTVGYLLTLGDL